MTTRWQLIPILCLATNLAAAATNAPAKAEIEGQQLAQKLRELRPAESGSLTGVLVRVRPKLKPRVCEMPVEFQTTVTATNWQTEYIPHGTNAETAATVTIIHTEGKPNEYRLGGEVLTNAQASVTSFAESDFSLADLGLEFLHWPRQRIVNKEMKSGEACDVLESLNPSPSPGSNARIVSWIDQDTGGIVQAHAYGLDGKRMKTFAPEGFTKVRGQWQVDELRINNEETGTYTRLKFKFEAK